MSHQIIAPARQGTIIPDTDPNWPDRAARGRADEHLDSILILIKHATQRIQSLGDLPTDIREAIIQNLGYAKDSVGDAEMHLRRVSENQ